jgi:hypothetical protein
VTTAEGHSKEQQHERMGRSDLDEVEDLSAARYEAISKRRRYGGGGSLFSEQCKGDKERGEVRRWTCCCLESPWNSLRN